MKKILITAASLMIAGSAFAQANQPEFTLVDVDMSPTTEVQKPVVVAKQNPGFGPYALENIAARGK